MGFPTRNGTCDFLAAAGEHLREHHTSLFHNAKLNKHFNHGLFHGCDFDNTHRTAMTELDALFASLQLRAFAGTL